MHLLPTLPPYPLMPVGVRCVMTYEHTKGMNVAFVVLYGLMKGLLVIKQPVLPNPFLPIQKEQEKIHKALEPLIEQSNRIARLIASHCKDPKSRCEMHIYRKAERGNTPTIAKILQRLINHLTFLNIIQSINSHPQAKPNKVSSRLHTLGVIPCAPNAFA